MDAPRGRSGCGRGIPDDARYVDALPAGLGITGGRPVHHDRSVELALAAWVDVAITQYRDVIDRD
jgi:hypothetical protein